VRVALATCAEVPALDEDGPPLVDELARRGIVGTAAVWDDPSVDWTGFDLVVLRCTWDYAERRDRFLAWVEGLRRVLNPPEVVRWNTNKRYLDDLAAAGVPVVPTTFVAPGEPFRPPTGPFVVKPAVSAGSRRSARYDPADAARAGQHVASLHESGDVAMVQPYLTPVDSAGETAVLYLGGAYSHAIRKAGLLLPDAPPTSALYLEETVETRTPTADERAVAGRALAAVPVGRDGLLYARVDLVPDDDGSPLVLEVELTEPSLFLSYGDGAPARFAGAIEAALRA
jgi:glutathione synthase/RimK-type ligase-like ATP-grasp enzyme